MRGVALCCGFNAYKEAPLATAVNDATSVHSTLMANRLYGRDAALMRTSRPITHDTATAYDVLSALEALAGGPADLIWFSFSGHGQVAKGELQLLLPLWAKSRNTRYAIGSTALDTVLRQHRHKRFIVVLDACQTGAFGMRDIEPAHVGQSLTTPGVVVLSSCGYDQRASDGDVPSGLINGLFTHCLLTLLRSHQQANTTLSALKLFIDAATLMRSHHTSTQRPTLYANGLVDDFTVLLGDDSTSASGSALSELR
jgi:uncharacterized caspase-like protein